MEQSELGNLYRSESRDHLDRLGRAVLAIENGGGKGAIDEAFRAAHTLKGMSSAMGHTAVVSLAHGLEHLLEKVRNDILAADSQVVDLLLSGVDELERVIEGALAAIEPAGRAVNGGKELQAGSGGGPSPSGQAGQTDARQFVRVEQDRIDSLMNRAGELVLAGERLSRLAKEGENPAIEEISNELGRAFSGLRQDALRLRLAPIEELTDRLTRLVRDGARKLDKDVELRVVGGNVEIDRGLLADLSDLLTHLVRNSLDHGIEVAAERFAAGKVAAGTIRVSATQSRDTVEVSVEDDGRGIDRDRVLEQAMAKGLRARESGSELTEAEFLDLLILPGFSTARAVTELSGRGVGLDHVAARLRDLGGDLRLRTAPGRGATFTITLPKTLSMTRVLLVGCGDEPLALPLAAVDRVEDERGGGIAFRRHEDEEVGGGREKPILVDLRALCGYPAGTTPRGEGFLVVFGKRARPVKFRVDEVFGFQEVVIKRFAVPRGVRDLYAGATVLSDGIPRLVLDPGRLISAAVWTRSKRRTAIY